MADDITKRMHYFDRQFLRADDFKVEQDYHVDRERRHARFLHTSGWLEGLDVTAEINDTVVTVKPGTALDDRGCLIVLLNDKQSDSLPSGPTVIDLYILFNEVYDTPSTDPGVTNQPTRTSENPVLIIVPPDAGQTLPPDPGPEHAVRIARIFLDGNGKVSTMPGDSSKLGIDTSSSIRKQAGTILGDDFTVQRLTFENSNLIVPKSRYPSLSSGVNGSLTIENDGIDSQNENSAYLSLKDSKRELVLGVDDTGGSLITITSDPLVLGAGTDGDGNKRQTLRITTKGNVGIGLDKDTEPDSPLTLAPGGIKIQNPNDPTWGTFLKTDENGNGTLYVAGHDLSIYSGYSNTLELGTKDYDLHDGKIIFPGGKVGIGTDPNSPPQAKLEVNGDILVKKLSIGGAKFSPEDGNNNLQLIMLPAHVFGSLDYQFRIGHMQQSIGPDESFHEGFHVDQEGNVYIAGTLYSNDAKNGFVADHFLNSTDETAEQGDVLVISGGTASLFSGKDNHIPIPGVCLANRAYDTAVCGIVVEGLTEADLRHIKVQRTVGASTPQNASSKAHPFVQYVPKGDEHVINTKVQPGKLGRMVTLGGFSHCKVDADIAPIRPGDLLTTSPTPGHAQKVQDPSKAVGAILGKALGGLARGKGKIPALVVLQ